MQIEDTGEGIAKADLPHIFKRFYKGKNADENSVGIGLAMAYSIIREQMGDIAVVSQEGRGTQFTIRFYR
ncbi:MAG: sensor histidine kinase [Clostridia bacterium]